MLNTFRQQVRPHQLRELSLVLLILLVLFFFSTQINNFLSARLFNRIATDVAILAVVAVGETLVVLTRNVDLSVGSIVGFTAYVAGTYLGVNPSLDPVLAVLFAAAVGAAMGAINGLLVAYGRVPAIITTLGTLALFRAVLVEFSGAKTVVVNSMPKWVQDLPAQSVVSLGDIDLGLMTLIALGIVLLFQFVLAYTQFGRRLYAIGSNPEGARFAGLPAPRLVMSAFVLSGALSGLAGFMFLVRFGNITVVAAQGMELQVVAAVVVGGVNIFGGQGTMIGALLGVILINILQQSLIRWIQISAFWIDALLGLLILAAVATDALIISRLNNLWARSEAQTAAKPKARAKE